MKIVHICLACFYVPNMAYQENILPRIHKKLGLDVTIITSQYEFGANGKGHLRPVGTFLNEDDIPVIVLPYMLKKIGRKFGVFNRLYEILDEIKPDIIFCHGSSFCSLKSVIKYKKHNKNVKLYADQHGDYYNSGYQNKKDIFHKLKSWSGIYIYSYYIKKFAPLCEKMWGTTPWRCQFLNDMYGVPKEKIELLVMGGDDNKIHFEKMPQLRSDIRKELDLSENDFVVITGGKIDRTKNIHLVMKAVSEINNDNIKLIVFGQPNDEMDETIKSYAKNSNIRYLGWLSSDKTYDYFLASDLAVFPGTHSVLWEQVCACGIPCLFKDWEGMRHVDVGGNAEFLYKDSSDEIKEKIVELYKNKEKYNYMKEVAVKKGISAFSYEEIAKRAIQID